MSTGTKLPYKNMMAFAEGVLDFLAPVCVRAELAGSLRRKRPYIGDIEIMAIPRMPVSLFPDDPVVNTNVLTMVDNALREKGCEILKDGPRYKQFIAYERKVDLFLQPDPRTWGMNMVIRTGSRDFSRWMVSGATIGGPLPHGWYSRNGLLHERDGSIIPTLEEAAVFDAYEMVYIPLEERDDNRWYKYRPNRDRP